MSFIMRTTKPGSGNKYYITKSKGGYSDAVQGRPTDPECDTLSNCVGYAYGRFNEIGNYGFCKYLRPVNAENFMQYKGNLKVGFEPKEGACMVWQKGNTLSNSDGAGHVAIVEKVINSNQIITSESGWNSKPFWNQTRYRGDGNWGQKYPYKFLGFIYNPAVGSPSGGNYDDTDVYEDADLGRRQLYFGCKGNDVKDLQNDLFDLGYNIGKTGADGAFGHATKAAIINFQKDHGLSRDGVVGNDTYRALENAMKDKPNDVLYKVRVTANGLNIRSGAGTNYPVIGAITDKGIYEISDEKDGIGATKWLRLKDRPGYIASDYTDKL